MRSRPVGPWWGVLLYVASLAVASGLLTFLVLIALGPVFDSGESWLGLAYAWWIVVVPCSLVLSAASALAYPRYRRCRSVSHASTFYVGNVLLVVVSSVAVAWLWSGGGLRPAS